MKFKKNQIVEFDGMTWIMNCDDPYGHGDVLLQGVSEESGVWVNSSIRDEITDTGRKAAPIVSIGCHDVWVADGRLITTSDNLTKRQTEAVFKRLAEALGYELS
jgi:hypothetical protein